MIIPRVVILTAISEEIAAVREFLIDSDERTNPEDGSVYLTGLFYPRNGKAACAEYWEVILPMPSGQGNVISAIELERARHLFSPHVALMVGVAGGIPKKVNLFDVIVADRIVYYEPGSDALPDFLPRPDSLPGARRLLQRAKVEQLNNLWQRLVKYGVPNEDIAVRIEPIAAGEKLCKRTDSDHFRHVRNVASRAVAVEMEGYGVMRSANECKLDALVIRGISDLIADKHLDESDGPVPQLNPRQFKASRHAAAFAFQLLGTIDVSWITATALPNPQDSSNGTVEVVLRVDASKERASVIIGKLAVFCAEESMAIRNIGLGSIVITTDVSKDKALLIRAAKDLGILDYVLDVKVLKLDIPSGAIASRVVEGICDAMLLLANESEAVARDAIKELVQIARSNSEFIATIMEVFTALLRRDGAVRVSRIQRTGAISRLRQVVRRQLLLSSISLLSDYRSEFGLDRYLINLSGANLSGLALQGVDLRSANLLDADLSGASLEGAILIGCALDGAKLQEANLSNANISDCSVKGADFSGAYIKGLVASNVRIDLAKGLNNHRVNTIGGFRNTVEAMADMSELSDRHIYFIYNDSLISSLVRRLNLRPSEFAERNAKQGTMKLWISPTTVRNVLRGEIVSLNSIAKVLINIFEFSGRSINMFENMENFIVSRTPDFIVDSGLLDFGMVGGKKIIGIGDSRVKMATLFRR